MIGLGLGLTRGGGIAPSLDLNFLTGTMPSGLTFTRASTATYIGSDGLLKTAAVDVPRFDYDPVTLACKGLLIEGSRTNLLLRSEEFSDAAWVKGNSTIDPNSIAAPTGALTADTLVANSTSIPVLSQGFSITSGTSYTASCFFKKKDVSRVAILFFGVDFNSGGANLTTTFDLDTGTITAQGHTTATITNAGGGWYRCTVAHLATATKTATVQICRFDGASTTSGFGTYVWGAVCGPGAFPTSYIPTTTAAVTRAADVCLMTGTNFTRWFNPLEGTFVVEFGPVNGTVVFGVGDTFNNCLYLTVPGSVLVQSGGVQVVALSVGSVASGGRVSSAYKANDFAVSYNGGAVATDNSGAVPLSTVRLAVGSNPWGADGGNSLFGPVGRLRYYPRRLSNARLQELST